MRSGVTRWTRFVHTCDHFYKMQVILLTCTYVFGRGCVWFYVSLNVSPATSHQLDHLVLIGCDDPGQAAGQQHANQLKDGQKDHLRSLKTKEKKKTPPISFLP